MLAAPIFALLLACSKKPQGSPSDLGALPADNVRLAESPALSWLVPALPGGEQATAADLLRAPPTPTTAPDPSALLVATQADNAARANAGVPLRLLSYNVALLDVDLLGFIPYKRTPFLDERRPELPELILGAGYDVLTLQEVWLPQDLSAFLVEAEEKGYRGFHGPREQYKDGVLTLVRADLIAPGTEPQVHAEPYEAQDPLEYFPGPHMKRGFVEVAFEHPTLGRVLIYNTHMLAWPANWPVRMAQARQLGRRVAAQTGADGLAFVGGDMNAASYYPKDTWVRPEDGPEDGWWANTLSYGLLLHYGGLTDLYVRGRPAEEATQDVTLGGKLGELIDASADGRVDLTAHCADLLYPTHHTATDCNVLYAMQYKDTEYPARMDLVLAADPQGRVYVAGARTAFTERQSFGGGPEMEPSDHLGVEVELKVAPPGGVVEEQVPVEAPVEAAPAEQAPVEAP